MRRARRAEELVWAAEVLVAVPEVQQAEARRAARGVEAGGAGRLLGGALGTQPRARCMALEAPDAAENTG